MTSGCNLIAPRRNRDRIDVAAALAVGALMVSCAPAEGAASEQASDVPTVEETVLPDPTGFEPVAHNADWTPVIQDFDGAPMALVPAGCFTMGSADGADDEQPPHEICFEAPFWIDVYEVTNIQFWGRGGESQRRSDWTGDEHPRESLTWFEASAFCELRGARLPTEAEWEYAARGPDGLVFPWGNEFDGTALNFCDIRCLYPQHDISYNDGHVESAPVGNYPGGVSWVGAYDMSGNVREWVSSLYASYPYDPTDGREVDAASDSVNHRVIRGGSWYEAENGLRGAARSHLMPEGLHNNTGFRCVRDP